MRVRKKEDSYENGYEVAGGKICYLHDRREGGKDWIVAPGVGDGLLDSAEGNDEVVRWFYRPRIGAGQKCTQPPNRFTRRDRVLGIAVNDHPMD